jgi:hypothetical protein
MRPEKWCKIGFERKMLVRFKLGYAVIDAFRNSTSLIRGHVIVVALAVHPSGEGFLMVPKLIFCLLMLCNACGLKYAREMSKARLLPYIKLAEIKYAT